MSALLPPFAKNTAHVSEPAIGVLWFVFSGVVALAQLPVVKLVEGHRRMRGLALMGVIWAGTFLAVMAGGAWLTGTPAAVVFGVAVAVFAPRPRRPRAGRAGPRGCAGAPPPPRDPRGAAPGAPALPGTPPPPPIDPETVNTLRARFGWHPLDVEDVLSKRQRPKVDDYVDDGYLFGVLHFPAYDKNVQRLNAGELDFFIGPDYLVTISNVELLPVTRLFSRVQDDERLREQLFSKGSGRLLYEVLDDLFDYCFPILDKIAYKLDSIEDDIEDRRSEEIVTDISKVKQEIISYRKIIKPQRPALRLLERHIERFLPEELELYFDDLVDASERIWDLLDNYKEVVEALESTNESVISHRQNDVLRILTVFSVILLPLTLISGIFGMNVNFPGFESAEAFWIIIGAMAATAGSLAAFFKYKGWL